MWEMDGLGNKLSFLFKGPGWSPGKPRLGCIEDIPKVGRTSSIFKLLLESLSYAMAWVVHIWQLYVFTHAVDSIEFQMQGFDQMILKLSWENLCHH